MIATQDIDNVATEALKSRDWKGIVVRELLGPRDLTYAEATRILGKRIGKPNLTYVQFSDADMAPALIEAGFSESFAHLYVEMTRGFNNGNFKSSEGRNPENSTLIRFEDFVDELAEAFQATDN
ncbi:MAG: hypothetical protein NPIRA01_35070 [Nitrospirales bacterium]|nr:MAG: hypothetical protein NPIRA01_35070 [Nitrospirales bacterium]